MARPLLFLNSRDKPRRQRVSPDRFAPVHPIGGCRCRTRVVRRRVRPPASLRLGRRAQLRRNREVFQDVVIVTELPLRSQRVWDVATGRPVRVRYLSDEPLRALERAVKNSSINVIGLIVTGSL